MTTKSRLAMLSVIGLLLLLLPAPAASSGTAQTTQTTRAAAAERAACKLPASARPTRSGYVLGQRRADASCAAGRALMRTYHQCLRRGNDEKRCRARGPRVLRDAPRIERAVIAGAGSPLAVGTESQLRKAWADPLQTSIVLTADIALRACLFGGPIRESMRPITVDGAGHSLRQTCFEKRILRQDGTGFVAIKNMTLTRGGNDGPGAAVTTRGEILVMDSRVEQNLSEEPGGGIFAQRRATVVRSIFTGNLANDDGGAIYARRGGVEVYDSLITNNLVDGSGGAIGSTGDILVVRSHVDGNTTDGDGGALYTDEDGDITVIDSSVDGNTADGPGGAIFTLDGDVTIVNSTLNGNRADDRGGAISGESDVTVIGSTIARNAAVAHVGGGIWARGNLYVANSTISNNYAEGQGGGVVAAGTIGLVHATIVDNISPVAANIGGSRLRVVRLHHRAGQDRPARGTGAAHLDLLPGGTSRVRRLQPGHRRFLPAHRWERQGRRRRCGAGRAGRERRVRRDPDAAAGKPRAGPHPAGVVPAGALRLLPRRRAAPCSLRH